MKARTLASSPSRVHGSPRRTCRKPRITTNPSSRYCAHRVGKDNPNLPRTYLLHCTRDNRSWAELSAKAHSWKSELLLASAKRQLESLRSLVAPENLTSIEEFFKVYENELREVELEKLASADDLD